MQRRNGFVCVARPVNVPQMLLFGPNQTTGQGLAYENLTTNGICLFENVDHALGAKVELAKRRDISFVHIASCEMEWAETEEDLEYFREKDYLFILGHTKDGEATEHYFFGPFVAGSPYPSKESRPLTSNGFACFGSFKDAELCLNEILRQSKMTATIGRILIR